MTGSELARLMSRRLRLLKQLMEISMQQRTAIAEGRMTDLMRLLSDKQSLVEGLSELAGPLRDAGQQDPAQRVWESERARKECAETQEACEALHLELLAIEAECEAALRESRSSIQQQLQRLDAGQTAARGYAAAEQSTGGSQLDLSSQ